MFTCVVYVCLCFCLCMIKKFAYALVGPRGQVMGTTSPPPARGGGDDVQFSPVHVPKCGAYQTQLGKPPPETGDSRTYERMDRHHQFTLSNRFLSPAAYTDPCCRLEGLYISHDTKYICPTSLTIYPLSLRMFLVIIIINNL